MTDTDKFRLTEEWVSSQTLPENEFSKCDIDRYRQDLEGFDLTAEEETELLMNLWRIMAAFVDMGFGLDSVQLIPNSQQALEIKPKSDESEQSLD